MDDNTNAFALPRMDLVCGRCAEHRPAVRPTTLALLSLDADRRIRVDPIVRTGGQPRRIYEDIEAATGRPVRRTRRTFRSAPSPVYRTARRFQCRACDLDRWLRLKYLAEKVALAVDQQAHVLVVEPDGTVRPLRGRWWTP